MIRSYFRIAWRSLKKQPFFTFLNIFGLAIGATGGLLISLYIYDELSFDTMFADADRIHRIDADIKFGGAAHDVALVPAPMAEAIINDCPQIEMVTRIRDRGSALIKKSDSKTNIKEENIAFTDVNFFEMFGVDVLEGDANTALKEPNTLVLTKTAVNRHFGNEKALGQQLLLNNTKLFTVTGIIDDFPKNSFLRNHTVFISTSGYGRAEQNNWGDFNFFTFVKLVPDTNVEDFEIVLQSFLGKYLIPWAQTHFPGITEESFIKKSGNHLNFDTIPLTDIHLHSINKESELSPNSSIQSVYILSFIGIFLILLASINFINLSTAYSLKRAKEVGIRKTLGSNKFGLIKQFLAESGLISFIALLFAIVLSFITLPFFNSLANKELAIPFGNLFFWVILLFATVLLSIISGWYPALFMSRFAIIKVLKGIKGTSGGSIRNSLVVFQFTISIVLIVATIVVFQQLNFIENKDLGFSKDQVLVVNDLYGAGHQVQAFKEEVQKLAKVKNASVSGYLPIPSNRQDYTYFKEGYISHEHALNMQKWDVDYDYISTLDMNIIAGRGFDKQFVTDTEAIIINESAVEVLGVTPQEAIGMRITTDGPKTKNKAYATIIGIVKNFHFESLRNDIGNLGLTIGNSTGAMTVLLEAGDFSNTISEIEAIWKKVVPGEPFNYNFMEASFNNIYKEEQKLGSIFIVFTILSIIIACLGLFGLAAFNAQKHFKEIGIRKVLGATVSQITYKLMLTFLKLVCIAILISLPISWYVMDMWLQDFSHRIDVGWDIFAAAIFIAVAVSVLTVSFQSIKAAIVNPIKSLRTE